ncbi:hypothetical protein A3C23_01410 [Candidatus Roizmanbacteria bacterium RIFCSPHIGHO2_02_FULL_37_13b]|uniref:Beta-ketoacyl-[acyl-carrier-protein] synthase III C-terminal domain-containing protein n=1 Tax=Candidatus Roizmanbacteria bacterium RIFCSPLOWO2_02_FULL_36_11 TaxID=1802071 RepID=A0A1F7JC44_9BACT|nr:MAG: hypothetical protein A3C23_01410 [Candidatus Roizmanbacteria bacterium RIFCSPHIGHO2_02_FULL_37_13b]OGK53198.1 MAG: hypothetical protein A3H78_02580 [Candidatus Roizmanbacteria bacterium RIFCSPLOWO2_02_FULL_36_11]
MTGIVSYGFYIPKYRIKIGDIAKVWGKEEKNISRSLLVKEKTVAGIDEDSLTMAYESSKMAFEGLNIDKKKIGAVYVGSESHPYAVNPTATILAEMLGIRGHYLASDTEFACKAATGAMISGLGMIKSKLTSYVLVSASDKAQSMPHDVLEYTASSASVSLLMGSQDLVLKVLDYSTYSTDTPDFWRRDGIRYPSHGGRFTGLPAYFYHIFNSSSDLLKKTKIKPHQIAHAVFHMPNGKFPIQIAYKLGFDFDQVKQSLVVENLGNSYTASALLGLVSVLEVAQKNDLIFFASFGSGAGSDAFIFQVTDNIDKRRMSLSKKIKNKKYIDYPTYLKFMDTI